MNQENSFSIFNSPLESRMIVEASAGTGKTYNIVGLFIRLLLEKDAAPDQILIVTFTRMAAKELKDRILKSLRQSVRAVEENDPGGDPFLENVIDCSRKREGGAKKLREAIRNFDDVNICTIHGFCQQILSEESLISGMPFQMEVSQQDDFLIEAAEDFWRDFIYCHRGSDAGNYLVSKALEIGSGPGDLLEVLKPALYNRHAETEADSNCRPVEYLQDVLCLRRKLSEVWKAEKEKIISQLTESDVSRITTHLPGRIEKMERFLNDDTLHTDCIDSIRYFLPSWFRNHLKKDKYRVPEHLFFTLCERYQNLISDMGRVSTWFLQSAAEAIWKLREEKSRDSSVLTYDDLVERLMNSLKSGGPGASLAARVRTRYPYALIDEFQDTDPAQYTIFETIYPAAGNESTLIMIGDPKQSIYAFRGADLYAYLRAREDVGCSSRYTLKKNFRSSPELVSAVNALFQPGHQTPFLEEQITYHTIESGLEESDPGYLLKSHKPVPLKIYYQKDEDTKKSLKTVLFGETVRQIRELVSDGVNGIATLQDEDGVAGVHRNLSAGDIAVLVYSHRDAEMIRDLLKQAGLGAVTYTREKVFETRDAERVEQILSAILDPADSRRLQVAATTGFFGNTLSGIYQLINSESALLELTEKIGNLNRHWYQSGCFLMMRKLLFEYGALEHLSRFHNSERIVTNVQQLIELSAGAEKKHGFDPPALLRWFRKKMTNDTADDEETLRLESDEDLVKITTIHNSKGLEFPVVFCPSLWSARDYSKRGKIIEKYHSEEPPFNLIVNLDQERGEKRIEAERRAHFEEVSEEVRKTYVALTRAKYECRIFWGVTSTCNLSGLGALLQGRDRVREFIAGRKRTGRKKGLEKNRFVAPLKQLADDYPELISFTELNGSERENGMVISPPPERKLSARIYRGEKILRPRRSLYSFSSLVKGNSVEASQPDHDQYLEDFIEYASDAGEAADEIDMFHFPRGKGAGTFIHGLFEDERLDFRNTESANVLIRDLSELYGYEEKWVPVLKEMMTNVLQADYRNLELNRVAPTDMLREMEFCFPAAEPDMDELISAIRGGGFSGSASFCPEGYMTGFIDLIVRQNGMYYILDYKSNYLGDLPGDYRNQRLNEDIAAAGYDIQYHLYAVALKKFLESRVPGFSYESGFGGVYYLYVRGMSAASSAGIFFDRPDPAIISNLEIALEKR